MFERTLEFRFDKFYEYWEKRYSIMLTIVFELRLNLREEAIFINSIDDEICLFKGNGEICQLFRQRKTGTKRVLRIVSIRILNCR